MDYRKEEMKKKIKGERFGARVYTRISFLSFVFLTERKFHGILFYGNLVSCCVMKIPLPWDHRFSHEHNSHSYRYWYRRPQRRVISFSNLFEHLPLQSITKYGKIDRYVTAIHRENRSLGISTSVTFALISWIEKRKEEKKRREENKDKLLLFFAVNKNATSRTCESFRSFFPSLSIIA